MKCHAAQDGHVSWLLSLGLHANAYDVQHFSPPFLISSIANFMVADGVLGMCFRVVTACKSAVSLVVGVITILSHMKILNQFLLIVTIISMQQKDEASSRIDDFLKSFRSELESMDNATFMEHLVGLAKNKLESFDAMDEETGSHWSEIIEGRYDFEAYRKEVQCLRAISKEQLIAAYDEWLHPLCKKGKPKKRRRMVLHVIGSGDGPASLGRPVIEKGKVVGDEIDRLVHQFHASVKHESWGRITFGSPELHRANTV